jgi:hypothetical protein
MKNKKCNNHESVKIVIPFLGSEGNMGGIIKKTDSGKYGK